MPDIIVHGTDHKNLNPWCSVADNPFYAATTLHPNPTEPASATWTLSGYPAPLATLLSGDCLIGSPARTAPIKLEVEIEQGGRRSARTFLIGVGRENRYGISFLHDGSPYSLTFSASIETPDEHSDSAFQILPLECINPVGESARPRIYRVSPGQHSALVSCNQGGLMNRIIPLMSAIQIAGRTRRTAYAWWGKNEHCAAEFSDIFDIQTHEDASIFADDYEIYSNYEATPPLDLAAGRRHKLIHSVTTLRTTPSIPNDFATAAATFADQPLAAPIVEKLERLSGLDLSRTIGFHIRRPYPSGAFQEQERSKFTLGLDVFIDLIERLRHALPEYERVLLCTNSFETEAAVKGHFGDYVFTYRKESIDNTADVCAVQDAVVDLILMSRCPILFSQETTAFGQFAHAVGNNKLFSVTIRTDDRAYEIYRFKGGDHVHTIRPPRADIQILVDEIRR